TIDLPYEEICYLVLHFGSALLQKEAAVSLKALVVCSSGIGTAKLLATKLQQQIPEIKQVENKSLFELPEINLSEYDLIVSTIPLQEIDREYVIASPMLEQADIRKIKKAVRRKKINYPVLKKKHENQQKKPRKAEQTIEKIRMIHHYSTAILQLLDNFKITEIPSKHNKEDILREACQTLQHEQVLEKDELVLDKLLKREEQGGLGIPGTHLVLFHTRSKAVKSLSFTIFAIDYPIKVQGMDGNEMQ